MYISGNGAESMQLIKSDKLTSLKAAQTKDVFIWGGLIIAGIFAYTSILHTAKGSPRYSR